MLAIVISIYPIWPMVVERVLTFSLALQSADGLMREVFHAMDIDHDGKISRER